jgi:hypothetical protein
MYLGVDYASSFSCKEGKITTLYSYGLIPSDSTDKDYCGLSSKKTDINDCNSVLYGDSFKTDFTANCINQTSCSKSLTLGDYVNKTTLGKCNNESTLFYV